MPELPFSIADVEAAAQRLRGHVHRTPLLTSTMLDDAVGAAVVAKSEHLQRSGSFKIRGALNRMMQMTPEQRACGAVAFSSGNHAQGVALAGRILGVATTIVMPYDAPEVKKRATRGYGAEIVEYDRYEGSREVVAIEIAERTGATLVHPFNDAFVAAGQGTCGLEVAEDFPDVEVALIPVGGGGLIAGMATALRAKVPGIRIIGVEPEVANDAQLSMAAGHIVEIAQPKTVADGVASPAIGPLTFAVIQAYVDEIITVPEDEILSATRFIATPMKQILEPTGALTTAALLNHRVESVGGKRVLTVFCGGNADLSIFAG